MGHDPTTNGVRWAECPPSVRVVYRVLPTTHNKNVCIGKYSYPKGSSIRPIHIFHISIPYQEYCGRVKDIGKVSMLTGL